MSDSIPITLWHVQCTFKHAAVHEYVNINAPCTVKCSYTTHRQVINENKQTNKQKTNKPDNR